MQNNPIYSDTNDTDNINLSKRAEISRTQNTKRLKNTDLTNITDNIQHPRKT